MKVSIYIKSHFRGNPRGAGEAAAVIEFIDKQEKKHTRQQYTQIKAETKNALHLKISIAAMRVLLKPCDIKIFIDCDYMANACRLGWLEKWQQDGWKKANGKPPANVEDWKQFYMLTQIHTVTFETYNDRYETELEEILGGKHEVHGIESQDCKVHSADYSTKD